MKSVVTLILAASLSLSAGTVFAADMPTDEPMMGAGVVTDSSGFDWDGFFATVYAAYVSSDSFASSTAYGLSIGGNVTSGNFLFGGVGTIGQLHGGAGDGAYQMQGVVRAGYLVTDNILLYGLAGLGWETYNDATYVPTGLGAEVAFTDNLSLRLQYQANYLTSQDVWATSISAGLSWYF